MEQSFILYRNLEEISAVLFHKIKYSGKTELLDKDYNESKDYEGNINTFMTAWLKLYDEYFNKTDDARFVKALKNKSATLKLLYKINIITIIVTNLESIHENIDIIPNELYLHIVTSLGNLLKRTEARIKFDAIKPIPESLKQVKSVLGGLETRYNILFKENKEADKYDISLYYEIKSNLEEILERNLPEHINMLQWIAYEKQCKKKVEYRKQQLAKTKR